MNTNAEPSRPKSPDFPWIDSSSRKPTHIYSVLLWIVGYDPPRPGGYEANAEVGIWNPSRQKWQICEGEEDVDVAVSHWMPLPPEPRKLELHENDVAPRPTLRQVFNTALAIARGYCPRCHNFEISSAALGDRPGVVTGVMCSACDWAISYDALVSLADEVMWSEWPSQSPIEGPWLIADNGGTGENRFRTLKQGAPTWTLDFNEALQFARRIDAERFAEEDEDAWRIVPVPRSAETQPQIEAAIVVP